MGTLAFSVHHDLGADVATARFAGDVTVSSVPVIRATLLACLAECPAAVVIDLCDVDLVSTDALLELPELARRRDFLPDVALLVCLRNDLRGDGHVSTSLGSLPVFHSKLDALAAAANARDLLRRRMLSASMDLRAPAHARHTVRQACADWGFDHLMNIAELVTSELVTNAVRHARTDVDVEVLQRGDFVHLRVRDQSTAVPRLRPGTGPSLGSGGRGLRLVDVYASGWGYVRSADGKVVWATMRARPLGARLPSPP
jgi:anti-sigma regulatory factor (Ser/Thr protein kinase)